MRAFGMLGAVDETPKSKALKAGFNRLAASAFDRDAWITILARLATRAPAGLDDPDEGIKSEFSNSAVPKKGSFTLADTIRDSLYNYILTDWKRRLDVAISWLHEEWYSDRIALDAFRASQSQPSNGDTVLADAPRGNYKRCALRLIDGITTYVEGTDKILVRFISEIPELDREILDRLRHMAEDPDRIDLACMVLQYLYMFRPPVRGIVVDCLEELWRTSKFSFDDGDEGEGVGWDGANEYQMSARNRPRRSSWRSGGLECWMRRRHLNSRPNLRTRKWRQVQMGLRMGRAAQPRCSPSREFARQ